jgi:hypothetical protein
MALRANAAETSTVDAGFPSGFLTVGSASPDEQAPSGNEAASPASLNARARFMVPKTNDPDSRSKHYTGKTIG